MKLYLYLLVIITLKEHSYKMLRRLDNKAFMTYGASLITRLGLYHKNSKFMLN